MMLKLNSLEAHWAFQENLCIPSLRIEEFLGVLSLKIVNFQGVLD